MKCVYVIQHTETKQLYIGKTSDLKRRLKEHNSGQQSATVRKNGEWKLIYTEVFRASEDADEREYKLKHHGNSKRWLKNRIQNSMLQD